MKRSLGSLIITFLLVANASLGKDLECRESLNVIRKDTSYRMALIEAVVKSAPYQTLVKSSRKYREKNHWQLLVARLQSTNPTSPGPSKLGAKILLLLTVLSPLNSNAQQSLFNVPAIEPTEKSKFFFQEQVNILPKEGVSNSTLDYGLGNGWSVGLSLYNLKPYSVNGTSLVPDTILNLEKVIQITPEWRIGIGTQTGINPSSVDHGNVVKDFTYLNNMYLLPNQKGKIYLGYYYANDGMAGSEGTNHGFMAGFETPLIGEHLNLMGDYISGDNQLSVGVLGVVWHTPSKWDISIGTQIPSPSSGNDFGVVLEFTKPTL